MIRRFWLLKLILCFKQCFLHRPGRQEWGLDAAGGSWMVHSPFSTSEPSMLDGHVGQTRDSIFSIVRYLRYAACQSKRQKGLHSRDLFAIRIGSCCGAAALQFGYTRSVCQAKVKHRPNPHHLSSSHRVWAGLLPPTTSSTTPRNTTCSIAISCAFSLRALKHTPFTEYEVDRQQYSTNMTL